MFLRHFKPTRHLLGVCAGLAAGSCGSDPEATGAPVVTTLDAGQPSQPTGPQDAGNAQDAGQEAGLPAEAGPQASHCTVTAAEVSCKHQEATLTAAQLTRKVQWQIPTGTPPAGGFPVVIVFQGSLVGTAGMWSAKTADPYGAYFQAKLVQTLLDGGFAVLTPEARFGGTTYWDTNVPPYATFWTSSPDHALMLELFKEIAGGSFGALQPNKMYAAGISSGGYMASRMAEAYPGKFRALAVHSASWATCSGAVCFVPEALPAQHPPTVFLHGEQDLVVPIATAEAYYRKVVASGIAAKWVKEPAAAHEWLPQAPQEISAFFRLY